jgi:CheY-like chemotaxis protein
MPDNAQEREFPALLLIDDDLMSRELVATLLGLSGYNVEAAADGAAALAMLSTAACAPGVILLDAQMPGLSGAELIAELRLYTHAPIVLISGSEPSANLRAAANGFLLKPFAAEDLASLLEELRAPTIPSLLRNGWERHEAAHSTESATQEDSFFDAKTLAQLRAMMPLKAVREIFTALAYDLDRRIDSLHAALQEKNYGEARRIGHAIKGGAAMAGAAQIARLGAALENGALEAPAASLQGDQLDNVPTLLADLRQAAGYLRRMLEEASGPLA